MPESWIRVESEYEATIESGDNPITVSATLYDQAKKEVVADVDAIVSKIKEANKNLQNSMAPKTADAAAPVIPTAPGSSPRPL